MQQVVDSRLVRRKDHRSISTFALPQGKRCVVLIDDLNLPEADQFNAHAPRTTAVLLIILTLSFAVELLRQLLDHQGWYAGRANPAFTGAEQAIASQNATVCFYI